MGQANDDFWIQVARYVRGNLSEEEREALHQQLDDPERRVAFEQARALWEQGRAVRPDYHPDVEQGWQRFQFRRDSEADHYRTMLRSTITRKLWQYVGVAASIVLLLGIGYFLWQRESTGEEVRLATTDRKEMYYLPDSSRVWLNKESVLRYAATFNQENRVVYLAGEAFFEVKKAEGRRFTVYSGLAQTEVIGTAFNVRAYTDDSVVVQVVAGKVAFSPRGEDNAIFLTSGQEARLVRQAPVAKRSAIDDPNFRAWQNNQLRFDNTQLPRIVEVLEQQYGTDIDIASPALTRCRYTASFDDASLEEVLKVLSAVGNIAYQKTGNRITLTGAGCP